MPLNQFFYEKQALMMPEFPLCISTPMEDIAAWVTVATTVIVTFFEVDRGKLPTKTVQGSLFNFCFFNL